MNRGGWVYCSIERKREKTRRERFGRLGSGAVSLPSFVVCRSCGSLLLLSLSMSRSLSFPLFFFLILYNVPFLPFRPSLCLLVCFLPSSHRARLLLLLSLLPCDAFVSSTSVKENWSPSPLLSLPIYVCLSQTSPPSIYPFTKKEKEEKILSLPQKEASLFLLLFMTPWIDR